MTFNESYVVIEYTSDLYTYPWFFKHNSIPYLKNKNVVFFSSADHERYISEICKLYQTFYWKKTNNKTQHCCTIIYFYLGNYRHVQNEYK